MRVRVRATMLVAAGVFAACQAVSGLGDLNKVDCAPCDGGIDPDAPPPCTHTFCASFDQSPANAGWKAIAQSSGAKVELDTTQPKSPPASLLTSVPANDLGGVEATLSQSFEKPLKGFHLELDLRVQPAPFQDAGSTATDAGATDAADADADAEVEDASAEAGVDAGVDAGPTGPIGGGLVRLVSMAAADAPDISVSLAYTAAGPIVLVTNPGDAGTEIALPLGKIPAPNTWAHLKLDVVFDAGGKGTIKATIDGAPALDKSNLSMVGAGAPGSLLTVGVATRDKTPDFKVSYDNLTLDIDP